jgi:hypothetical protein
MNRTLLFIACLIAAPAWGQSLCTKSETVVFACKAKAKIISVCASQNLGPHTGYLQFRIGSNVSTAKSYPASRARKSNSGSFGYTGMDQSPPGRYLMLNDGRVVHEFEI